MALQQIKERGALPMIDRGDIPVRHPTAAGNIQFQRRGAGYGRSIATLTAWLQNSKKRAERSERLMYEQATAIIPPGYLHHRLPVMGC